MSGDRSSVWLVAQDCARGQRAGRYVPGSFTHPGKMLPALARHAIETYTAPGDLVADPMCGIGTTLVEAARLGRDGFGIDLEPRWVALATANLALARQQGATGHAEAVVGDGRDLGQLVAPEMRGGVALVLTSPPYGPQTHGQVTTTPRGVVKQHHRYSADRANLANAPAAALLAAVHGMLATAVRVLRPDGTVVVTARPWRRDGRLVDLPGQIIAVAERAGLTLVERNVALLCAVRDSRLVPRASFFQLHQARLTADSDLPRLVVAHEDVLVFRAPANGGTA
jgi:modification methylase